MDRDHARPPAAAAAAAAGGKGGKGEGEGGASGEHHQHQQKEEEDKKEKPALPSRAELEAAGQAGGGYPGSSEAAAVLVDDLQQGSGNKEACEDCN